ncbi:NAD(P)H-binding protein [Mesorhizobium sp. A556]
MATQSSGDDQNTGRVSAGTGFLGRRIVTRLAKRGYTVRAVSRHPGTAPNPAPSGALEPIRADILDARSTAAAIQGSYAVINAVSLYAEHGDQTFERVHVKAAGDLAAASSAAGIKQCVLISGVGSDPRSESKYIRARGRGEDVVESAFPGAFMVRPSVMTGPDDAFLTTIVKLLRRRCHFNLRSGVPREFGLTD